MARARATVVDLKTLHDDNTYEVVRHIYGPTEDDVAGRASDLIDGLSGAEQGRYAIDVSIKCETCGDWHSSEAECQF